MPEQYFTHFQEVRDPTEAVTEGRLRTLEIVSSVPIEDIFEKEDIFAKSSRWINASDIERKILREELDVVRGEKQGFALYSEENLGLRNGVPLGCLVSWSPQLDEGPALTLRQQFPFKRVGEGTYASQTAGPAGIYSDRLVFANGGKEVTQIRESPALRQTSVTKYLRLDRAPS